MCTSVESRVSAAQSDESESDLGRTSWSASASYLVGVARLPAQPWSLAFDLLVLIAAAWSVVDALVRQFQPHTVGLWLQSIALGVAVLLLLGRHRFPFAAPAAVWIACPALAVLNGALVANAAGVFVAGLGAALLLGNLPNNAQARTGLGLVVVGTVIVVERQPGHDVGTLVFTPMLFVVAWVTGHSLRERAAQARAAEDRAARAEHEREIATRLAVAEERARIARELHDVVAHALSVMVLQVGVLRRRMPAEQTESKEVLGNVEQAGRTALTDVRLLLDAMRNQDDELELGPRHGLADLSTLVQEVRATGVDVQLAIHGDSTGLPAVLDLSAYRIVQEGLTNALKHAQAHRIDVDIRIGSDELCVEVRDHGRGQPVGLVTPGYGLVGIRERVSLLGGSMATDSLPDGYVLRASMPREAAS